MDTYEEVLADPRVKAFLRNIRDEDARQEARIKMWQEYTRLEDVGNRDLAMYLLRAGKWGMLNHYRKKEPPIPVEIHEENPYFMYDLEDHLESIDAREKVRAAVDAVLSTGQKDKVFRKFWLDEVVYLKGAWWYHNAWGARAKLRKALDE